MDKENIRSLEYFLSPGGGGGNGGTEQHDSGTGNDTAEGSGTTVRP